ncbi:MAG: hypothetical protein BGN88_02310, partial [Clostridiales bacterium 43-6]
TRLHGDQNRIWVDFDEIPDNLANAFIAIEDKRFNSHKGVDWKRTFSAFANMFVHIYDTKQGGSTITQQLVKNITGDDGKRADRKIREIMRARYLEGKYPKDTILECYMNTIHLGPGVDGVEVAANYYFDKHVGDLTLTEMAAIASCTKSEVEYNPYTKPEKNKERRNFVLSEMKDQGYITEAEYNEAVKTELVLRDKSAGQKATPATVPKKVNSYFVDAVIEDVAAGLMAEKSYTYDYAISMIYKGGFNIYTTLDTSVQEKIDKEFADKSNFLKLNNNSVQPQSAICIMDYEGHIVGMVGGRGEKTGNRTLNRATQSKRQPGSSIKPLSAYAPALEFNLISYGSKAVDSPMDTVINGKKTKWPKNYYSGFVGTTSIKVAIEKSINTIPVKLIDEMTPRKSFDFMTQRFGFTSLVESQRDSKGKVLSDINLSALGVGGCTYGVTVREMTAAYATFGNLGVYWKPTTYTLVTDQRNEVVLKQEEKGKRALGEDTANIMNKLLQNVVLNGTGTKAAFGGYPIIGKTGTTTDDKDRWFVGATPYYVAAVWYGFDQPKDMSGFASNPALKVWKACMESIHKGLKVKDFPQSDEVVYRRYCTSSGKIAREGCGSTAYGWFKKDDAVYCSIHGGDPIKPATKPGEVKTTIKSAGKTTVAATTAKPASGNITTAPPATENTTSPPANTTLPPSTIPWVTTTKQTAGQ